MTKVSTNAGKHPYLRNDIDLFSNVIKTKNSRPIDFTKKPFFNVKIETEFIDKNGETILFKDSLIYEGERYEVTYDGKNFCWCLIKENSGQKTFKLEEVYLNCVKTVTNG